MTTIEYEKIALCAVFCPDPQFLALQGGLNALSPPRVAIRSQRSESNGDCSSGVEPRIVIPVVAGSNPVSHPTHHTQKWQVPGTISFSSSRFAIFSFVHSLPIYL